MIQQTYTGIATPDDVRTGVYANAFRLTKDGDTYLLDFITWSPREQEGEVVTRVRLAPDALHMTLETIIVLLQDELLGEG